MSAEFAESGFPLEEFIERSAIVFKFLFIPRGYLTILLVFYLYDTDRFQSWEFPFPEISRPTIPASLRKNWSTKSSIKSPQAITQQELEELQSHILKKLREIEATSENVSERD